MNQEKTEPNPLPESGREYTISQMFEEWRAEVANEQFKETPSSNQNITLVVVVPRFLRAEKINKCKVFLNPNIFGKLWNKIWFKEIHIIESNEIQISIIMDGDENGKS